MFSHPNSVHKSEALYQYTKYFENREWSKTVDQIYKEAPNNDPLYNFPEASQPEELEIWAWLDDFQKRYLIDAGYPIDKFPAAQFASVNMYFQNLANEHLIHLRTQRNLADDPEDAQKRFIARHRFKQLIPQYCIEDAGPFKPFCDDLQPSNMLADPKTFQITAVLDFEFTNTMPAQFAYDPPWWLLLLGLTGGIITALAPRPTDRLVGNNRLPRRLLAHHSHMYTNRIRAMPSLTPPSSCTIHVNERWARLRQSPI